MSFDSTNFVNVGPNGTLRISGTHYTTAADIDAIFNKLTRDGTGKLVVHFHGGLVNEAAGIKVAQKMVPVYTTAGSHAVTFVWETGVFETVRQNLDTISHTKLFRLLLKKIIGKVIEKLGVSVGGRGPGGALTDAEIEAELDKPFPFEESRFNQGARGGAAGMTEPDADLARQEVQVELEQEFEASADFRLLIETEAPVTPYLKTEEIVPSSDESARALFSTAKAAIAAAKIFYHVVKRFIRKRDHGLYPTVIEEILRALYTEAVGGWIWSGMKRSAKLMWSPNDGITGDDRHAGRYFLDQLARHQAAHALTVDVVGHSAGAIAILEMMSAIQETQLAVTVRHALFLAPACTTKRFHQCLTQKQDTWQTFRMFTMDDTFEQQDRLLGAFYPRSLLYFVSGLTEDTTDEPILGMQRFLSGKDPFDDQYLLDVRDYVQGNASSRYAASVWGSINPAALEGFRTSSITHGGFDDDPDTRASLQHLIKQ
jgi:hypothetical protein